MAIAVQLDFDGMTLDQYDEVIKRMGFTPGGQGGPGVLFHWVTKTDKGLRVTDVWESRALDTPRQIDARVHGSLTL